MGSLNCAAFVAGVIKGVLDAAGFVSVYFLLVISLFVGHNVCVFL